MFLRMGDAVDPSQLPPGLDAYAGYDDGNWPDFPNINGAHPGVPCLELTVYLANRGVGLDIEPGDAHPVDGVGFVIERTLAGIWRPVLYCSRDDLPAVVGYQNNFRINRGSYRLWSAHYGEGQHICGPSTCGSSIQADATQWIDHGGWDESMVPDWFFQITAPVAQPPVAPPPQVFPPTAIPGQESLMNVDWHMTTGQDGTGYVTIPIPSGCTRMVAASADVRDPSAVSPPSHDVDVDQLDAAGSRDASGVVCQPCVGAQAPGTQRVRLVGGASNHFYTGHAIFA